jgi:hypothetical protein
MRFSIRLMTISHYGTSSRTLISMKNTLTRMTMSNTIKIYVKEAEFRLAMKDIREAGVRHWPVRRTLLSRPPHVLQYEIELEDGPITTFLLLKYDCFYGRQV